MGHAQNGQLPASSNLDNSQQSKSRAESYYTAGQWQLFWSRFRANRLAAFGAAVLGIFIVISLFAEFFAPYSGQADTRNSTYTAGPPQMVRFCDSAGCQPWPFVHDMTSRYNVIERRYEGAVREENGKPLRKPLRLFHQAGEYKLFGVIPSNRHLFGVDEGWIHLFGTDQSGLDLFSRIMFATRTSLSISFFGIAISFVLSLLIGGVAVSTQPPM